VILAGTGDAAKLTSREMELLGGAIAGTLQTAKVTEAAIAIDQKEIDAAIVASGVLLRNYSFGVYKTKKENNLLASVNVMTGSILSGADLQPAQTSRIRIKMQIMDFPAIIEPPAIIWCPHNIFAPVRPVIYSCGQFFG
jgi:leucyl aminopeptidase